MIRTYTTAFNFFNNTSPFDLIQTVEVPGGTSQGYWWGCYTMAVDVRKKPRDTNQAVFLSFAQNATWWAGRVIKITRENENSKWNEEAKTKIFFTTEDKNKRDVLQNILLLENDQIAVCGNYLTLFDADLNQLK